MKRGRRRENGIPYDTGEDDGNKDRNARDRPKWDERLRLQSFREKMDEDQGRRRQHCKQTNPDDLDLAHRVRKERVPIGIEQETHDTEGEDGSREQQVEMPWSGLLPCCGDEQEETEKGDSAQYECCCGKPGEQGDPEEKEDG